MHVYIKQIKLLLIRVILLLALFQLTRLFFFFNNYSKFSETNTIEIIWAFLVGVRFDLASISIFNTLFIFFSILPFAFILHRYYQSFLKWIFVIVNSLLLISNLLDSEYFKFTQKRSTFDVFQIISGDDFSKMTLQYLKDFWLIDIFSVFIVFFLIKFYPQIQKQEWDKTSLSLKAKHFFIFIFISAVTTAFIRGFDHRPIAITSAAKFASSETVSLVLNTPFTIIKTINKSPLIEQNYYSDQELTQVFSPIRKYASQNFRKLNVVILIVESFGKEYSALNNSSQVGYMPFLDSLSKEGLRFRYSFANGKRSMEAMPSIFNASPALMDQPYIISQYASNQTEGLAVQLKNKGYYTSFMHGGANGTMDFDKFCYMSGFEDYYGKDEYHNPKDFDGNWGIYDEPYLQYCVKKMSDFKKPFFNAIFTLSSHHPYSIPQKYQGVFPKGTSEIHESIGYVDYSIQQFFESAMKEDWFDSTLFVITADHTSISEQNYFQRNIGTYAIPIIFYQSQDSLLKGESLALAQHIDIMPSILDYLHYPEPFYAIGSSVFDPNRHPFFINYMNERYSFASNQYFSIFYEDTIQSLYFFPSDSLLKKNLIKEPLNSAQFIKSELPYFKAIIQTYNNDLIFNRAYYSSDFYQEKLKSKKTSEIK